MNLGSLVADSDGILEEYERVSSGPHDMWMDWGSDFHHGANWQILPVFASRSWVATHYSSVFEWESIMSFLADRWPKTLEVVLSNCPLDRVSLVAFSRLRGGNELKPHEHDNKGHMIFHMGVEIPEGDVGIQTSDSEGEYSIHKWKKPKDWLLFDDNMVHSAWNRTSGDRVLFYMDIISPVE